MDVTTVQIYDASAETFACRHRRIHPTPLLETIRRCFHERGRTADIGCGCGRDAAWLSEQGYSVTGFDASRNMLAEARAWFPGIDFRCEHLPALIGIPPDAFDNALCSAVLMHVARGDLEGSAESLCRILKPDGRLVLSWRRGPGGAERDTTGRLFTAFEDDEVLQALESASMRVLWQERQPDPARPGIIWEVVAGQKRVRPMGSLLGSP